MTRWFGGLRALLTLTLVALLPFGPAEAQESDQLNRVDPQVEFLSVSRAYSDMDAQYARVGVRREIAEIRRIAIGQSQSDVQAVLGRPAAGYDDGSLEFHLSLPLTARDRLICQYRVFLDGEGGVARAVWRRPQCAELALGRPN